MLPFPDAQRRVRLARRHGLHPGYRHADAVSATRAMTVLHATEAASVYLSLHARVDGLGVDAIDDALFVDRSLVKQLAMRRTLFGFPRDLLPAALGSASARVASTQLRLIAADVERSGVAADGLGWVEAAAAEVLACFGDTGELDAATVRRLVPAAGARVAAGSGRWTQAAPVVPRLLTLLGARGELVRGRNAGHWRTSRPVWTPMRAWFGGEPARLPEAEGYAELVRRWLWTFGPGTDADLAWWLGATKAAVRRALADVAATPVRLDSGDVGWVLPGDEAESDPDEPWVALLPALDPTTMGWKQRDFYLDPSDVPYLFDNVGNGGTTAWCNGRVVGCWVQEPDARVRVVYRRDPGAVARRALEAEAERLTAFVEGAVVSPVFASPQMRAERA